MIRAAWDAADLLRVGMGIGAALITSAAPCQSIGEIYFLWVACSFSFCNPEFQSPLDSPIQSVVELK